MFPGEPGRGRFSCLWGWEEWQGSQHHEADHPGQRTSTQFWEWEGNKETPSSSTKANQLDQPNPSKSCRKTLLQDIRVEWMPTALLTLQAALSPCVLGVGQAGG